MPISQYEFCSAGSNKDEASIHYHDIGGVQCATPTPTQNGRFWDWNEKTNPIHIVTQLQHNTELFPPL